MYTSLVTPQPKGLSNVSEGIQAKHPNTAVTAHGDLWNQPCRSISQSSLKTLCHFLLFSYKFCPLLESFAAHFTDKEERGTEKSTSAA